MSARRSCLSVPATNERFQEKADQSAADMVILDLEDSVAPAAKEQGRALAVRALTRFAYAGKLRAVRVNAVGSRWCHQDVIALVGGAGDRLDSLVVPKVEGPEQVHFLDMLLTELGSSAGLELQIETARGMENAGLIAGASPRVRALHFGPGDFAASMGIPGLGIGQAPAGYPGEFWHYFHARVVTAARAHGVHAVDGPFGAVRDLDGLREAAARAAMIGFDGKWALNPQQVEVINEVFTPGQEEFDRAQKLVEAYERATEVDHTGAVLLGEEMIDEASRKMAAGTVERGRAAGLHASR
ncbi:MAG TPA: CoA ester lyase [Candidatus Dormibacteraeota bacterium]